LLKHLLADDCAATAIEYALIAALISLAAIIAFLSLGLNLGNIFITATDAMAGRHP
jgi:pilus assembly protein Flp/PilA